MAKYLTLFQTKAEYDAAKSSLATPNVSYCEIDEIVAYMKDAPTPPPPHHDYSQDYFTIVPKDTATVTIKNGSGIVDVYYSTDDGSSWNQVLSTEEEVSVSSVDKILMKGSILSEDESVTYPSGIFSSTVEYDIEGNIMSLVCGDDFTNATDLTNIGGKSVKFEFFGSSDSNLVSAENLSLPATTLANSCYYYMFQDCSSLTTAPELPATTLAYGCYSNMFNGCTSLTTAPELPATTLASECYNGMFAGCRSLTTAPELPAKVLTQSCYNGMFYGCTHLNYIKCLAIDISASYCTYSWVTNVASTGTFIKNPNMPTTWSIGSSGIPSGWTVQDAQLPHDYIVDYFTIVPQDTGKIYIGSASNNISLEYSTDSGSTWGPICREGTQYVSEIDVTNGDKVLFRGTASASGGSGSGSGSGSGAQVVAYPQNIFTTDVNYSIEGNIMSLVCAYEFLSKVDLTNFDGNGTSVKFEGMFQYDTYLVSAENLSLPATTLTESCYREMFQYCSSLTTAPELPATTLANSCYYRMFYNCTGLTSAPDLPATTLATECYESMFYGCTGLTTAPSVLPATTLANKCYEEMFYHCTGLTTAPALPATTLAERCYDSMFYDCTSLATAPELPATTLTSYCYRYMFLGCTGLTTAPELPATTLAESCYQQMFQGCSSLTTVPALPATTLANGCYYGMFNGCTSLTTAPATLPATTLASNCYYSMFKGCTSLTTAPELPATTLTSYCYRYMFLGCTGLTTAPALPATTLANYCCQSMFQGCTSLTTAPELPATTLAGDCYSSMFEGCTSLNYIKCLATDISASYCTTGWVTNVAATGTFVKDPSMSDWTTGNSGIPSGWTVEDAS